MRDFFKEHSLSIVLFIGFLVFSAAAILFAEDMQNWAYDWSLMVAGSFGGGFAIVIAAKYFWEPGSAPDKPPPKKKADMKSA